MMIKKMPGIQSIRMMVLIIASVVAINAFAQEERADSWSIRFSYGGGTPNDAGPLGHCIATISSNGRVRVESRGRRGVKGPRDAVIFKTDSLDSDRLNSLFKAADNALREEPFKRQGSNEDGEFLRLIRNGHRPGHISHSQLRGFSESPPGMQEFVKVFNQLLPKNEQIPLGK
jgi:hypothetical protein